MVKLLHIQRDGKYHSIKEVATSVQLTLSSKREYLHGDNSDIIPTDTIKNTVHVLAKFKGIKSIETFAMNICEHFLSSFNHVIRVQVYVEEVPWKRFEKSTAFIMQSLSVKQCTPDTEGIQGFQHYPKA
ncbi:UOX [Cervus elaphus hippelaphus]|uniref:Uricase n=1 Tax=Cervus elaphus hippelaphus TaxID=46360 RepID=A0A212CGS5_CEREH|nr:UOX [Cervus elaphus hippelaphus]